MLASEVPSLISGPVLGPFRIRRSKNDVRASAFILVELDFAMEVTCICCDVLSAEKFIGKAVLPSAFRPRLIEIPYLRLGRRYSIKIIASSHNLLRGREIYFQTPDACGAEFNICVVSGFRPQDVDPGDPDVLSSLSDHLSKPWHGIDLILHVALRPCIVVAIMDSAYMLMRTQPQDLDSATHSQLEEKIMERFREEYRTIYKLSAMSHCLSSTANLITSSTRALLAALNAPPPSTDDCDKVWFEATLRAIHLARTVAFEYELQLWNHQGWADRGKGHGVEGGLVTLHDDTIGLFIVDLGDGVEEAPTSLQNGRRSIKLMSDAQKSSFIAALSHSSIVVLIIVLECPLLKPRMQVEENYEAQWEFSQADVIWFIQRLQEWRADGPSLRDVKIVCGTSDGPLGWAAGLRSILSAEESVFRNSDAIEQIIIGPICGQPNTNQSRADYFACTGKLQNTLHFCHLIEDANHHYRVLELTTERLCAKENTHREEMIGTCELSNPLTNEDGIPAIGRVDGIEVLLDVSVQTESNPGFVPDNIWYLVRSNREIDAMNAFVGGAGHGSGDENFVKLLKKFLFSEKKLAKIDKTQIETCVISLYNALPSLHQNVMADLSDPFVVSIIVTRASAEFLGTTLTKIDTWHSYVSRCFSLAAALREAVLIRSESMEQKAFPLITYNDDDSELYATNDPQIADKEFNERMNTLAETNPAEYDRYTTEMKIRAANRLAGGQESVW
eukprot:CAMPEP_0197325084 /NCGR_PEP_ID=MMETSP0891-20130614/71476_1 /TAXON_ID=44058 ORGANISM="Aureoumbra lagunensis, Strain CCMP1510" /NCGR_SAMPLE_ID=MMETSP0891 /ASSEMBLY_ACC=CAM_ASM_000534 /LENGTH=729 /DNA_ID=CAMNT_0042817997 /DNA_START=1564 /DNA_END=3750 /DNA_ORIENTATION=+